ncbi:MAG TPA: FAD binding domain-containing protein [Anaerolineales bacterium]|nr:FAD binding domain-containing protein [Anaerolineales bacterium]
MWQSYINAATVDEVLEILADQGRRARIVAGGTDLLIELERGQHPEVETLVDITRIPGLSEVRLEGGVVHLGGLVTHNHCAVSPIVRAHGLPLARASWEVGAPQIRNRSTVAGNIITGSPANDTITPLMALGAQVRLRSLRGERTIAFSDFYTGIRKTVLESDEMLVDIDFPALTGAQAGAFVKLGLRRAQAISVVHVAVKLTFDTPVSGNREGALVREAAIALGAVTPVIVRAAEAEAYLTGRALDPETIAEAAALAVQAGAPIDDVRSSASYRNEMVRVCTLRALRAILEGTEAAGLPEHPITLWGPNPLYAPAAVSETAHLTPDRPIETRINGRDLVIATGHEKTLLRWLREDAGLIGTKEGCAEGECGACTIFLDGAAVMSCLVPAPRAHKAEIVTVEGLACDGVLHPVQAAFAETGAVQCGYCTPGFIMSAAKLLEENPHPQPGDLRQAITGNLCRCTGYYKILDAMEIASRRNPKN